MPGESCVFPKCSTSRKDKMISLFKVQTPDKSNDQSILWIKDLTNIILKYSVKDLIKRMQSYKLYIHKGHLTPYQTYSFNM